MQYRLKLSNGKKLTITAKSESDARTFAQECLDDVVQGNATIRELKAIPVCGRTDKESPKLYTRFDSR